jgi:hypothetical protein
MPIDINKISQAAIPINLRPINLNQFFLFRDQFNKWIHSSKQIVAGLPSNYYIVSGITDAFNQTYALYETVGIFNGEYGYHSLTMQNRVTTDLSKADVIIISHPFSADGMSSHDKLKIADTFNKPIFVDCAFFGVCKNINFDFTQYKNIHSICFSLSKTFGTGRHRVGLLYTNDMYPVTIYDQWQYPLVASAEYHYRLLNTMSPDTMVEKYQDIQLEICNELKLIPSDTIMFGLDYSLKYKNFERGNVNRLCLSNLYV